MLVKCKKCGYEWNYRGVRKPTKEYSPFIACARCKSSIKLEK